MKSNKKEEKSNMGKAKPMIDANKSIAKDKKINKEVVKRRQEVEETLVAVDRLKCPKRLSTFAKKEWKRVMKIYKTMKARILNDLDVAQLSMYCESYATWAIAQERWAILQKVYSPDAEEEKEIRHLIDVMERMTKVINSLSEQLCLSPVGRARMGIAIAKKDEESSIMSILEDDDDEEE